jgi:alcohol dehydrogenase YqhD (iron-dependent ADH family)
MKTKTNFITEYIEKEKKMNKTITIGIIVIMVATISEAKSNSIAINWITTSMKEE